MKKGAQLIEMIFSIYIILFMEIWIGHVKQLDCQCKEEQNGYFHKILEHLNCNAGLS